MTKCLYPKARGAALWWLAWLAAVLPVAWRRVTTADAWWHVSLGRALWEHRGSPDFTQWYFTPAARNVPDLRWTFLGDLFMALVHGCAGAAGLQALSLACLAGGCWLLRDLARRRSATAWPWLVLLAVATYQLQLPRNAVFSLPLLALVFWLFERTAANRRGRWWFLAVAGLWSVLHGSYPLAVAIPALLLAGEWLEAWRAGAAGLARQAGHGALIVAGCAEIVTLGNPSARELFAAPFHGLVRQPLQAAEKLWVEDEAPAPAGPSGAPAGAAAKAPKWSTQRWLNGLLWSHGPGGVRSGDFASPFDRWGYRAVPAAFALTLLALARLAASTGGRWPWALALAGLGLLASAYLRMVGYLGAGAAACLLAGPPLRPRCADLARRFAPFGTGAVALAAAASWFLAAQGTLGAALGKASHEFGYGAIPIFDERVAAWVLAEFPGARTFTTIASGSHAGLVWRGRKPVFTDGFFAPHPHALWEDYQRANAEQSPRRLQERYGIELALVEHTRTDWSNVFLNSAAWRPVAVGAGEMVFASRRLAGSARNPALLVGAGEAARLSPYFRHALATNYFGALLALILAGDVEAARTVRDGDLALFAALQASLSPAQRPAALAAARALEGAWEIRPGTPN